MQKIMFNEQFGLQQATFDRLKTMTRRVVPEKTMDAWYDYADWVASVGMPQGVPCYTESMEEFLINRAPYKVGEIVAIAQSYRELSSDDNPLLILGDEIDYLGMSILKSAKETAGWNNKMFVKAEHMPHHIRIVHIKVEALGAISYHDCLREGIIYTGSGYTCYQQGVLPLFRNPYAAFKALIDKLNRRGFFESNPIVYAYQYELVD